MKSAPRLLRAGAFGVVVLLLSSMMAVFSPVSHAAALDACTVEDFTAERPHLTPAIDVLDPFLSAVVSLTNSQRSKCLGQRIEVCLRNPFEAAPAASRGVPVAQIDDPINCRTTAVDLGEPEYFGQPLRGCWPELWHTMARWEHDPDNWKIGIAADIRESAEGECTSGEVDYDEPVRDNLEQFILNYRDRMPAGEDQVPADYKWDENSPAKIDQIIAAMKKANSGTESARIQADRELQALGYELTFMTDTVTGRNHLVFHEPDPESESALGWGLYVLRYDTTSAPANLAVEVPHPFTDPITPELGSKMYVDLDAKMYAMAGTNRYNSTVRRVGSDGTVYPNSRVSDMARSYESLFHKVHTNFTTGHRNSPVYAGVPEDQKPTWSPTHVLQLHGYEPRSGREGYPAVILSNGSCQPHAKLGLFASRLNGRNISADVFEGDSACSQESKNYPDLGATINPQGKHTREKGGYFYHVEASQPLRDNLGRYQLLTKVLGETLFFEQTGHSAAFGPAPGFNPEGTAAYAIQYALTYNPNYYDWDHRGAALGGDSTNFASQALASGGWQWYQPVGGAADHRNSEYWFFRGDPDSGVGVGETAWPWVNAESWNSFAKKSGRVEKIKYLSDVGLGDIVQMSLPDSKNEEYRSMVVTGLDARGPLVSYHSPNTINQPLWNIVKANNLAWSDANANATHRPAQSFSAWRTISVSDHAHRPDGVSLPGVPTTQARHELDAIIPTPESTTPYDSSRFRYPIGSVWNNCNTRQTVLRRDGRQVQADAECRVLSGIWFSEYDGVQHTNPGDLEIDHVVSRVEAWRSGAEHWTDAQREVFANDWIGPELRAVTSTVNSSKGGRDPEQWQPMPDSQCDYAKHWIRTKTKWSLSMQQGEIDALRDMLTRCPD